eukprot:TRINITY_DN7783_c0_g1_i1.p1 TRINITY_DN7783_c0_g1~~TRINITY_DN7783_c0_g1_i1.p1  ORF type:complete len:397 (-),score=73.32 TRINITY_DN7783_c0_g1_i1:302-1492(-)
MASQSEAVVAEKSGSLPNVASINSLEDLAATGEVCTCKAIDKGDKSQTRRYANMPLEYPLTIGVICTRRIEYDAILKLASDDPQTIVEPSDKSHYGEELRTFRRGRLILVIGLIHVNGPVETGIRVSQFLMTHKVRFVSMVSVCVGSNETDLGKICVATAAYYPQLGVVTRNAGTVGSMGRASRQTLRSASPSTPLEAPGAAREGAFAAAAQVPHVSLSHVSHVSHVTHTTHAAQHRIELPPLSQLSAYEEKPDLDDVNLPQAFPGYTHRSCGMSEVTDHSVHQAAVTFSMRDEGQGHGIELADLITTGSERADAHEVLYYWTRKFKTDAFVDREGYPFLKAAALLEVPTLPVFSGVASYADVDCSPFLPGIASRAARTCYDFLVFADDNGMWEVM